MSTEEQQQKQHHHHEHHHHEHHTHEHHHEHKDDTSKFREKMLKRSQRKKVLPKIAFTILSALAILVVFLVILAYSLD